jgi:F-type H+-transporting ATP synthase subunit e
VAEKKMQEEYRRKEQLIAQAKAEYAKRYRPATTGGVITDPDDPNFDLEAFLQHVDATQP